MELVELQPPANPLESCALRYRVGNIEIDAGTSTVRRSGRELALQPKIFGVLRYLLENRHRVISKDELLVAVWQGESVHESTVPWSISHVRDALGQRRGSRLPIETVHRRGYRFAADVEVMTSLSAALSGRTPHDGSGAERRDARPYVGQGPLLAQLSSYVDAARAGQGRLCVLSGEAGIGKTRTAQELVRIARSQGMFTFGGRCLPESGGPSYWPWIQILRDMTQVPALAAGAHALLTELERLGKQQVALPGSETDSCADHAQRFWLADDITRFLAGTAAEHGPLCLYLDDLHAADAGSLALLGFLVPELAHRPILVLATNRSQSSPHVSLLGTPLARLLATADRVEVPSLGIPEVAQYIALVSGMPGAPEALVRAVYLATSGVPLFVQECVRELIRRHGAAALPTLDPAAVRLPESAREVLRASLQALHQETRVLLSAASVLGSSFELPLLSAITGLPMSALLLQLQAAERAGFLTSESPQRMRFSHALLQALLYDELPSADRVHLHRKAAETLEAAVWVEPRAAEIALHYYRALPAGTHASAAAAARNAARAAESVLDYGRASHFYDWALEADSRSSGSDARARAELLLAAGRAQRLAGRARQSQATLQRLFELAREHRFADLLLSGARVLRPSFAVAVLPDPPVRNALEDVLRMVEANATDAARAWRVLALSHLACIPPHSFDIQKCKQLTEQALALARELGQVAPLLEALRARLYALSGPEDTEALLLTADEMLRLDREHPSIMSLEAFGARAGALSYRGDVAGAEQALAAFGRTAHDLKLLEAIWYYDRQRAQRLLLQGDYTAASANMRELHARSRQLGLGYGSDFLAPLERRVQNDLQKLNEPQLRESALAQGLYDVIPYMRAQRARFAAERGDLAAAKSSVDWLASQGFENLPREVAYLNTLANLAVAVTKLGDLERAEQLYTLLSPHALMNTPDGYLFDDGAVSRYLALPAATLGWHERVEAHFRAAIVVNRDMGRRPEQARTYYDYAVWISNQDQGGASSQAQSLAREASMLAESVGMQWLAQLARELMT